MAVLANAGGEKVLNEKLPLDSNRKYSTSPSQTVLKVSSKAPDGVDIVTGEIPLTYDIYGKWRLQRVIQRILGYEHRVNFCHRYLITDSMGRKATHVEVRGSDEHKPYFAKLMACGYIWLCPVCAPKIQVYRANEVRQAIESWKESNGSIWMVTQTIPHSKFDSLSEMLPKFSKAFQNFKSSNTWTCIKSRYDLAGYIKALEVTWSLESGWHPHLHTIFFSEQSENDFNLTNFELDLFYRWKKVVSNSGLGEVNFKAFDVQDASKVKTYLNKMTGQEYQWSAEQELTKSHSKKSKRGYSPFDLAREYYETGQEWCANLFREYERCFKGKRHLVKSNHFKTRVFNLLDITDEEIASSVRKNDPLLAMILEDIWDELYEKLEAGWQADLLNVVELHGKEGLERYLSAVLGKQISLG